MKSVKTVIQQVAFWVAAFSVVGPVFAADLSPNIAAPAAKTPPSAETAIKVPAAIPLEAMPAADTKAPSIGAKRGDTITVQETLIAETITEKGQTATAAEIPSTAGQETRPTGFAPKTGEQAELIMRAAESGPSGRAEAAVSIQMRAADPETVAAAEKKRQEEGVYFNVAGEDIREIIKQISRLTGTSFIIDDKIRGNVTIINEQKLTTDEVYEAFLSALDVAGYTTVSGPAGLTKIIKKREAMSSPIPIYTDRTPYSDRFITRLLTLKNISAIDMANAVKGMVSKEGNLFAYPATNTLILTDSGTNIDRIIRLVQELDTEGPQEILEIIPIEYADVKSIADKITQLFGTSSTGRSSQARPTRRARRGQEAAASTDALPPLNKVLWDERTNSIIILASKITIAKVKDVIRKLDRPLLGPEEGDIHVLYLKNAKAVEIAEVLTGITEAAKKDQPNQPRARTAASTARGRTGSARQPSVPQAEYQGLFGSIKSIRADEQTNALIIQANAKDFKVLVDQIISKLDIPRRQVYVEATIMEVSIRSDTSLGTGLLGGTVINAGGNKMALFGNTFPFIPNITTTSSAGATTTTNPISITPPFSDSAINFPKFFAAFIAQQGDTELNILSTPNILTLDNTEARIKVGDTIPFLTGSALTTGGVSTSNITREDIALELSVTPQITEGDNVRMVIKQKIEDFSNATNPLEATAGPATSIREIESEVVVPNGQTVVLGGLMQDKDTRSVTKVPLLGDIPIIGWLFKGTSVSRRKVNLLVFLTPTIIREPRDFLVVMQKKIEQRNDFIDEHFGKKHRKKLRATMQKHNQRILDFQSATTHLSEPDLLAQEAGFGIGLSIPGSTAMDRSSPPPVGPRTGGTGLPLPAGIPSGPATSNNQPYSTGDLSANAPAASSPSSASTPDGYNPGASQGDIELAF